VRSEEVQGLKERPPFKDFGNGFHVARFIGPLFFFSLVQALSSKFSTRVVALTRLFGWDALRVPQPFFLVFWSQRGGFFHPFAPGHWGVLKGLNWGPFGEGFNASGSSRGGCAPSVVSPKHPVL